MERQRATSSANQAHFVWAGSCALGRSKGEFMTKQQILDTLEALKELTNDTGKQTIDSVKASIHHLHEQPPITLVPIVAPPPPKTEEPKPKPEQEPKPKVFKPLNVATKKKPKGAKK